MQPVPRPRYQQELLDSLRLPEVKVLTGVRRCGKSTILRLLADQLQAEGLPPENVVHLSLDAYDVSFEANASWLMETVRAALDKSDPSQLSVVCLDEVQEVKGWERVVRRLLSRENTSVYITGSNAKLLSGDLGTYLAGRHLETPVHPLSFAEYLDFRERSPWPARTCAESLDDYLLYGGMPGLFDGAALDADWASRYLSGVFDTVLLNDVLGRAGIQDRDLLDRIVRYVFSTSGSLLSPGKIANTLTSAGRPTRQPTVDDYLAALCTSLALQECPQVGVGKEVLRPKRKYYPADLGLRNLTCGFSGRDLGWRMECAVHNELVARGWDVHVGVPPRGEVDFVATRGAEKAYYQVTATLVDPAVYQRELAPLDAIPDAFPRYVITYDGATSGITERGVRIVRLQDWLLGE